MHRLLILLIRPLRGIASWLSQQGLLPAFIRLKAPYTWRLGPASIFVPGHQSILLTVTKDDDIGKELFWSGLRDWESETLRLFKPLIQQSSVFVDVGSNSGIYSLLAARMNPQIRCLAFEPVPEVHQILQSNIARNGFGHLITARPQAVGDRCGQVSFHVSEDPTMSSLNPDGYRNRPGRVITVDLITLDELIKEKIEPDLIKIDVESFEDAVLRGMPQILNRCRPILLLECNSDGPAEAIEAILSPLHYQFFHLTGKGPERRNHIVPDPDNYFRNWLMVPPNRDLPTLKPQPAMHHG